ncbi:unnamed protein product [Closterium sp. NIES-54]
MCTSARRALAVRLQLRERFRQDLPVLRLHCDRGGVFSSGLLRDFCRGEGILQSFTLLDSPQKNRIAERRIGLVMKVARTSMIHAAAPHFLWPFAVQYAAHQLNLWSRVSLPETSPTLRWTGKVGDASVFRVWDSRAFVRDTSADKLSARAVPCGPPPSGVSEVDPLPGTTPVEVAVGSSAARGVASGDVEPAGVESEGAGSGGAEPGGAEIEGAKSGGPAGASPSLSPWPETLSPQQLREWLVWRARLWSGATGARGVGVTAGARGTAGTAAAGPGSARTRGTGAARTGGVGGAGAGGVGAVGAGAGDAGAGGAGAGGARAVGAGARGTSAGGAGAGGARAVDPGAGGAGGTTEPGAAGAVGATVDILGAEDIGDASALSGKRCSGKGKGGKSGGGGTRGGGGVGSGGGGGCGGGGSGGRSGGFGGGGGGSGGGGGGGGGGNGSGGGGSRFCRRISAGATRVVVMPTKLLRGMELQEATEEDWEGEAKAVGEALAEGEAEVTTMRGMGALVAGGAPDWRVRAGIARRLDTCGLSVSADLRDGCLHA